MNRRVGNPTHGGVGGGRCKVPSYPITTHVGVLFRDVPEADNRLGAMSLA